MRFAVVRMRKNGVPLDKRGLAREVPVTGELLVEEHRRPELCRSVLIARLSNPSRPREGDLLPLLYDVRLLWVAPQGLTLAGFERITERDVVTDYAQSWWCRSV